MSTSKYYHSSLIGRGGAPDCQKPGLESPSPVFGRQFDSGFSDTMSTMFSMPMQVEADSAAFSGQPPPPPHLIVPKGGPSMMDAENSDSGIIMEEDAEKDCGVVLKGQLQIQAPAPSEVSSSEGLKNLRNSTRSPVLNSAPAKKIPRMPKKSFPGSSSSSVSRNRTPSPRTIHSEGNRPSSPRTVYSEPDPLPPAYTTSAPYNKENMYSMPAMRSNSPLTCNMSQNFRSLQVANSNRVPPVMDIHQLQEYMELFLPNNKDGDTGFHLSVIHNKPDILDKLLFIMSKDKRLKPVIDEQNRLYQTALHLATHLQQVETMRKLLIAGASVNITDHKGNTPLHIAAKFSSTRPLEELVRYISIQTILEVSQVKNNEGLSCIHIAAKNGNMEVLRKLRSLGVDMNMQDLNSGKTALHLAVENNSLADVQFLLETCEADVNSLTYSGCSPLHMASGRGDISIVAYLVSMGANPDLYTDEGDIALDLAGSDQVHSFLTKAAALQCLY